MTIVILLKNPKLGEYYLPLTPLPRKREGDERI